MGGRTRERGRVFHLRDMRAERGTGGTGRRMERGYKEMRGRERVSED